MSKNPPEVMDKLRGDFIKWFGEKYLTKVSFDGDSLVFPEFNGSGKSLWVPLVASVAWEAWQESRQVAVIELPEKVSVGFGTNRSFTYILVDELIKKLESQGYRVEVKGG